MSNLVVKRIVCTLFHSYDEENSSVERKKYILKKGGLTFCYLFMYLFMYLFIYLFIYLFEGDAISVVCCNAL